ncbi:4-deoxy-L-threo-5-hexulose uronate isomerase [Chitinophaga costaii]|uniref:4-deoxy-L-threo-5-hexosulose-uronate ketol-isomerase n=1 Tax=Chitinophaga costaii TaxID=1335309 RepID=A0A1C4CKW1_9BACT|nr:5-dehydro-4-deoxy-D-glucuronate isomerase [Chitinophaga costaii]PUZ27050.1 5-dehydro-4-deoxy-D-glucuronate isomerase [Chitinophaga costaii]SCC19653.1 4-deoxy-L-threo-5-hexulose uronate isomerase [Chitinophaga costaii]
MRVLHGVHPTDFKHYDTATIRERFLLDKLIQPDQLVSVYTHYDRMIVGGVHPVQQTLTLKNYPNLRSEYFLERREIGIINVGGEGQVTVDGASYYMQKLDCLYVGKGAKHVTFRSKDVGLPAVFFLLSAPAHTTYPTTLLTYAAAAKVHTGNSTHANLRTIHKYIHLDGIQSCQLVMGLTILHNGSIWNTMPAHVHDRRMEAYFYFDLPAEDKIFHYMGEGHETRHVLLQNYEAIVSPPWSIHTGSATASYSFIWGMAGENLDYTDMDAIRIADMF